jgi:nitrite reductase (NADH) small subunit
LGQFTIGKISEIEKENPFVTQVGNLSVAVYRHDNKYYAYLNRCPHQGGPACEGAVIRDGEIRMRADNLTGSGSGKPRYSIVCPWHGWSFEIESGVCRGNTQARLRSFKVLIQGDNLAIET